MNKHEDITIFETLFMQLYKPLLAYAFRFVNDKNISEDIVQDVFCKLWQQREHIRFEDNAVKSYLFKSVYTHALNVLNKKPQSTYSLESENHAVLLEQYISSYMINSEQSLLLKELETEIRSYIKTLPPQCQKIFILSRKYGLKNRQIAEQLNISIKAVEKQISKALFNLKKHLYQKELLPFFILDIWNYIDIFFK